MWREIIIICKKKKNSTEIIDRQADSTTTVRSVKYKMEKIIEI